MTRPSGLCVVGKHMFGGLELVQQPRQESKATKLNTCALGVFSPQRVNPAGETRCLGPIPIGPTRSRQELRYREILLDSGLLYQQLPTESCATNAPHHNCHAVSVPKQPSVANIHRQ